MELLDQTVGHIRVRCYGAAVRDDVPHLTGNPGDLLLFNKVTHNSMWVRKDDRAALAKLLAPEVA